MRRRAWIELGAMLAVGGVVAVAFQMHQNNKQVMRSMWSDLHNIAVAQEAYFADNSSYGMDVSLNGGRPLNGSVIRILRADATSWEATATHPDTRKVCTTHKQGRNSYQPVCR